MPVHKLFNWNNAALSAVPVSMFVNYWFPHYYFAVDRFRQDQIPQPLHAVDNERVHVVVHRRGNPLGVCVELRSIPDEIGFIGRCPDGLPQPRAVQDVPDTDLKCFHLAALRNAVFLVRFFPSPRYDARTGRMPRHGENVTEVAIGPPDEHAHVRQRVQVPQPHFVLRGAA